MGSNGIAFQSTTPRTNRTGTTANDELKPSGRLRAATVMTAVVDIGCPDCDRTRPVQKVGIDRYRCGACGREFGPEDVLPG